MIWLSICMMIFIKAIQWQADFLILSLHFTTGSSQQNVSGAVVQTSTGSSWHSLGVSTYSQILHSDTSMMPKHKSNMLPGIFVGTLDLLVLTLDIPADFPGEGLNSLFSTTVRTGPFIEFCLVKLTETFPQYLHLTISACWAPLLPAPPSGFLCTFPRGSDTLPPPLPAHFLQSATAVSLRTNCQQLTFSKWRGHLNVLSEALGGVLGETFLLHHCLTLLLLWLEGEILRAERTSQHQGLTSSLMVCWRLLEAAWTNPVILARASQYQQEEEEEHLDRKLWWWWSWYDWTLASHTQSSPHSSSQEEEETHFWII